MHSHTHSCPVAIFQAYLRYPAVSSSKSKNKSLKMMASTPEATCHTWSYSLSLRSLLFASDATTLYPYRNAYMYLCNKWASEPHWRNACLRHYSMHTFVPQTYIMYQIPYVLFTSYQIVKTRRLSSAYHLKWRKLRLMHLCRSVDVST